MARLARTLEDAEREGQELLHVAIDAVEVGQVEAAAAVHGVPADGALERRGRGVVVAHVNVSQGQVVVEAVERLAHGAQLARVLLDAAVRQALEERGEAEPLQLVGGGAVLVHVLLGVLGKVGEKLGGLLVLALQHEALAALELLGEAGLVSHQSSKFWR